MRINEFRRFQHVLLSIYVDRHERIRFQKLSKLFLQHVNMPHV
jgi:hypothetical protein